MSTNNPRKHAEGLVGRFLNERLQAANEPPGVRGAIVDEFVDRYDDIEARIREQIDQLVSPSSRRIPDAYFNDEEELENSLQRSAAGFRAACAAEGYFSGDPRRLEANYADLLAPSARWAVLAAASRVPRPTTRTQVLDWSLTPIPWHENESEWPPAGAVGLKGIRQISGVDTELVRVTEKPYEGWIQLGMIERQGTLATRYPEAPARQVVITTGLEALDGSALVSSIPLSSGPPTLWAVPLGSLGLDLDSKVVKVSLSRIQGPLAGVIDYDAQQGSPNRRRGAGLHPFPLLPRLEIVALLGLKPEDPAVRHCLLDDQGPALVGRLWQGFLIHDGNYSQLEPAVHGSDLIIRPDLYDRLEEIIGKDRIKSGITVSQFETDSFNDDD